MRIFRIKKHELAITRIWKPLWAEHTMLCCIDCIMSMSMTSTNWSSKVNYAGYDIYFIPATEKWFFFAWGSLHSYYLHLTLWSTSQYINYIILHPVTMGKNSFSFFLSRLKVAFKNYSIISVLIYTEGNLFSYMNLKAMVNSLLEYVASENVSSRKVCKEIGPLPRKVK